ncbi:S-layer homology domain-containing protein [Phosphitispora fastidiosa]|uniref:S-layer homology domain-containing protein n=1 Tax=Phosphitispora fastidiosa TaxID=2837202 RepID=UPI001E5CDA32|nr:S-layer homology domain-containing protein [Phosphitispora fastidiosa]MBU7008161.1 hypothetical protein [Phosphitispora fastidiosa]
MRKFKRMIALVTVALFVLAFAAPAGAATFSDVSGASSDSVYRLNALGIIDGYPDGTFKPEGNITRAEFAKIAMAAAGNSSSADFLKNATSKFSDVKAGEWYTGWVNLAASLGYIQGYPDGTFKPNANITYAECVTILVRLLGYSDKLPGEWPTEYLVKAAELGITDDVAFSANVPATRGDIAIMTSETLDQNVVVWDKDVDDFAFKKDADDNTFTLLADKFDGAVYDEEDYKVTAWEVDSDGQFVITIEGEDNPFTSAVEEGFANKDVTLAENAVVDGGMAVPYLTNHLINFIYNSDDEEATYVDVVSTKVKSDDVDDDGAKLKVNGTSYKFADGCYLTTAPTGTATDDINFELEYTDESAGVLNDFYDVYLDADGKIYFAVEKTASGSPKMVEELESDNTLNYMDSGSVDLDQDDVLVLKDGKYADVDDLKATDIVYVTEDNYGLDVFVDAYSLSKSGEFEAGMSTVNPGDAYFEQARIDGKKYDLDADMLLSTDDGDNWDDLSGTGSDFFDDIYDEEIQFALDRKGDIAFILTDAESESKNIYGIVDKVLDKDLDNFITSIKIMKSDGATVSYTVETADVELTYSTSIESYSADTVVFDGAAVKFQLNDSGNIDDLEVLDDQANSITDGAKDLKKLYIDGSWYYVNNDTIVLNGPTDEDPDVVSTSSLLSDAEDLESGEEILCWAKVDGNKVEYVMIVGATVEGTAEDMAMVIDTYYYDGDEWAIVDIRGEEAKYEIDGTVPSEDTLVEYSLAGSKISLDVGDSYVPTTSGNVYGEITDVDTTNNAIEVANTKWYDIDADTYIYDMTESDPVYVDGIDGIDEGDAVFVVPVTGDDDRKGVANVIFIVDTDDYTGYTFSKTSAATVNPI